MYFQYFGFITQIILILLYTDLSLDTLLYSIWYNSIIVKFQPLSGTLFNIHVGWADKPIHPIILYTYVCIFACYSTKEHREQTEKVGISEMWMMMTTIEL